MNRKLAELLGVSIGDRVTVLPVKGRREPFDAPVVEISNSYIGLSVYCDVEYLSRLVGEVTAMNGVQLSVDPNPGVRRELFRELKRLPALKAVNLRADVIANLRRVVRAQRIFISLLVLFAGIIFFCSLLNASLIALAERLREVATLARARVRHLASGRAVPARKPAGQLAGHANRPAAGLSALTDHLGGL